MTKRKQPPPQQIETDHDPYKMRTLEQIIMLFDGGAFMTEVMTGHQKLMQDLLDHNEEHGPKGCAGTMTLQLSYAVGNSGDVGMGATITFKAPKKPPSSAGAYINDAAELTLYSPMMRRMHGGVRDVADYNYDLTTGEIRDPD